MGEKNMAAIYNVKNKNTNQYIMQVNNNKLVKGVFDLQWINLYMTLFKLNINDYELEEVLFWEL